MAPFRYRKPGYVALNVSNLEQSLHFYRDLVGLTLEHADAGVAYLRCSDDHHNVVLYQSDSVGIKRMAFELESPADLAAAESHLKSIGCALTSVPDNELAALHQGRSIRFKVPGSSLTFEYYARMERAAEPFQPTLAKIQRLGHVVIGAKNRDALLKTLTEQLNFRVSDYFGDLVVFLRCFPNPYHHSFGLSRTEEDRFHHINFMVSDIDDIGRANNRMRQNGVEIVYGPGRHDISNSVFLYFLDPDGMTVEYSFGMEEFAEAGAREPRQLPPVPQILDSWGGMPAQGFGSGGTVESR